MAIAKRDGRYAGRKPDEAVHRRVLALLAGGHTVADTARLAGCSPATVKRVRAAAQNGGSPS
ncbi:helix-turn-helix domain-containing protein [Burkholderia ubonensis]|uniref:helix-turn-helix domain-containing protein n=1 Tax=Burkholderia ubonensis TaxID=101571 RepID=UPI00288B8919|nr:helix-turn-helix domain-containing protein [Burkholderia ubonensis]